MSDDLDPDVDLDPQDAIDNGYDEETDTEEDPVNDEGHPYEFQRAEGAQRVPEEAADEDIFADPGADDDVDEDDDEEEA